jgi:hypothetical protein
MANSHEPDDGRNDAVTEDNDDATVDGSDDGFDRRSYLKMAGATAAVGSVATAGASAAVTRHGIGFDRVGYAVDDRGMDPNGGEDIKYKLQNVSAGTLVEFPNGVYTISPMAGIDSGNVGLLGVGDDVRFKPSKGTNQYVINTTGANKFLFENIDIDQRASNTLAGMKLITQNGWHIQDVEFLGRGAIEDWNRYNDEGEQNMFSVGVQNRDAVGLFRNVVSKKIAMVNDSYPSSGSVSKGRVGFMHAGGYHQGICRLENCDLREARNNAMYMSRCPGDVQVVDSYFENNNVSSMRFSGPRSFAKRTKVVVDASKLSDGAIGSNRDSTNFRGFICEQKKYGSKGSASNPTVIRNCEFVYRSVPSSVNVGGVVNLGPAGRNMKVVDTTVTIDVDGTPAFKRRSPGSTGYKADGPHWLRLDNVTVNGSAANGTAVYMKDADGSYVRNACIHQASSGRDGVTLNSCSSCAVENSTIDVTGTALDFNSSNVSTNNISKEGSCSDGSHDDTTTSTEDSTTTEDTSTDDGSSSLENVLTIYGDQGGTDYEFTVSGDLEHSTDGQFATIDDNDAVEGSTATGHVNGGQDSYRFSGVVTDFQLSDPATVYLNGTEIAAADIAYPNLLTIFGDRGQASYEFTVGQDLAKSTEDGATVDDNDTISGTTASGQVYGGKDSYRFAGGLEDFSLSDPATVILNGKEVDPSTLGSADSTPASVLTIFGDQGLAEYDLRVSGELSKSTANGASTNDNDVVDGTTASGQVNGGKDSYEFTGEIVDFDLSAPATVILDGKEVDPTTLGGDLPHALVLEGTTDDQTSYKVSVSGDMAKGPRAESDESVSDGVATGLLEGGVDAFRFSGHVEKMNVDGNVRVVLDE